ncbi:MAG TPA: HupE/UreJ family protein [Chthoniobacterales bacterium]|jgi:hydrogenase/urease accessory protein HupE
MSRFFRAFVFCFVLATRLYAHDEPTSFIDIHLRGAGLSLSLTASATDLAHDLPAVEPAMLLQSDVLAAQGPSITAELQKRLTLTVDQAPTDLRLEQITPVTEKRDVRLEFTSEWTRPPAALAIRAHLFPYDPSHRTYLNIYENGELKRQEILTADASVISHQPGSQQSLRAILWKFLYEGVHHIFIGPDHILFLVALLLPGASLMRLLKIVTAFTIAHSITLGLATFHILTPPASLIEPVIALSVVVVGINAFLGQPKRDARQLLAFCFGLIHGFGFANVLQEMILPRHAFGWSLFTFNLGVELGQAAIVLAIAPLLIWLQRRHPAVSAKVVSGGALAVTTVGAFWFFQRLLGE